MTTSKLYLQNLYEPTLTTATIASSGDVTFTLSITPSYTKGFITFSPSNTSQREIMWFDDVVGSTVYVKAENRGLGGTTAKAHTQGEIVAMKDVAEIFNFFSDNISNAFYVEKKGGLNVNVWGGSVFYNGNYQNFSDTALLLTASSTNYIQYDYATNTISASLTSNFKTKAIVVTSSTSITSITYQIAKESYIDFVVTLNTALPSQPGNAGKVLTTDGTNASWNNLTQASNTVAGVAEIAIESEIRLGTATGGTGAPLVISPTQLLNLGLYGDGSDGNVTISVNTTLTRDMYYNDLTVNTGITLDPAGYTIYVLGTLTLTGTAKIIRNGNNGTTATGQAGQPGGAALATGTCGPNLGGGAGGSGGNVGIAGVSGVSVNPSYATTGTVGANGGAGGFGSSGAGGTGGTGGTATQGVFYNTVLNFWRIISLLSSPGKGSYTIYGGLPSGGGGGGSGGTGGVGNGGGGGGGNGGNIFIYANTLAGTGTIEAKGGVGGNGYGVGFSNIGGGGGGAGGSGGSVTLVYHTGTPYTMTLTGGAGGTGGVAGSGGSNGVAGGTGTTGQSIIIQK